MSRTSVPDHWRPDALGAFVRQQRELLELSQAALARAAGISKAYLNRIERGEGNNIGTAVLVALARELGLAPLDLLLVYAPTLDWFTRSRPLPGGSPWAPRNLPAPHTPEES